MSPHDRIRLRHMIDAIHTAQRFTQGHTRMDLDSNEMLLFALVRAVEVIGEAAARVSVEAREQAPDIPWPAVVGMRNRLIHPYFDVNRDILWSTVTQALPQLLGTLESIPLE